MSTIKLEFYDEAFANNKNVYGKLRGSIEDATTSTAFETATIPGGAVLCRVAAGAQRHFVSFSTATSTASTRSEVKANSIFDIEIPLAKRTGSAKISYAACT